MADESLYLFSYLTLPTSISISNKSVALKSKTHKTGSSQSEKDIKANHAYSLTLWVSQLP